MIRPIPAHKSMVQLDVSFAIVNIVLLLIFFFLATGQLLNPPTQGIELSKTTQLPLDRLPAPILIVRDSDTWSLNDDDVDPDLFGAAIANLDDPDTLHVLIGRDAPATSLLDIMDRPELSALQIKLVTLRTAPPS